MGGLVGFIVTAIIVVGVILGLMPAQRRELRLSYARHLLAVGAMCVVFLLLQSLLSSDIVFTQLRNAYFISMILLFVTAFICISASFILWKGIFAFVAIVILILAALVGPFFVDRCSLGLCSENDPPPVACVSQFLPYRFNNDESAEVFLNKAIPAGSNIKCANKVMKSRYMSNGEVYTYQNKTAIGYQETNAILNQIGRLRLNTRLVSIYIKGDKVAYVKVR